MNNMVLRAITGAIYVILIVGCTLLGPDYFWFLMTLFVFLAMKEFQGLFSHLHPIRLSVRAFEIVVGILLLFLSRCLGFTVGLGSDLIQRIVSLGVLIGAFLLFVYMPVRICMAVMDKSENPLQSTFYSALSMLYIVFPLSCMLMADCMMGPIPVLATFIFIWVNDTAAYIFGITFGKHRLCERLSPKKSWEGFWGGFIFCIIAGIVTAFIIDADSVWIYVIWAVYAALVSVLSTFGDLFESLYKRQLGVKDSGTLIPGHGGILDRIDSLLAVAPIALLFSFLLYIM